MEKEFPGGSWPVMLTPYTDKNEIDYDALKELVDWYIENGVSDVYKRQTCASPHRELR